MEKLENILLIAPGKSSNIPRCLAQMEKSHLHNDLDHLTPRSMPKKWQEWQGWQNRDKGIRKFAKTTQVPGTRRNKVICTVTLTTKDQGQWWIIGPQWQGSQNRQDGYLMCLNYIRVSHNVIKNIVKEMKIGPWPVICRLLFIQRWHFQWRGKENRLEVQREGPFREW